MSKALAERSAEAWAYFSTGITIGIMMPSVPIDTSLGQPSASGYVR